VLRSSAGGLGGGDALRDGSAGEFRRGLLIGVAVAAVLVVAPVTLEQRGRSPASWRCPHWCGWVPSPTASIYGTGQSFWRSTANAPDGPGSHCSRLGAAPHWQCGRIMVADRTTDPALAAVGVPLLPLAAATVASAAAMTLMVIPVRTGPGLRETGLPPASRRSPRSPRHRPAGVTRNPGSHRPFTVSVFGDSIGWTWMHYFPDAWIRLPRPHRRRLQPGAGTRIGISAKRLSSVRNATPGPVGGRRRSARTSRTSRCWLSAAGRP